MDIQKQLSVIHKQLMVAAVAFNVMITKRRMTRRMLQAEQERLKRTLELLQDLEKKI